MRFALPSDVWTRLLRVRFPTIIGLVLLMLGVGAGIALVGQGTGGFLPRASEDAVPRQVRITNVTDKGFSVSFLTDVPAAGYLQYGNEPNRTATQVRDDRDQLASSVGSFTTHHITVTNLQPSTQYYFRLGTDGSTQFDNNGEPFSVRTAPSLGAPPPSKTAYGTVRTAVGNPANGALVYLSLEGAAPISALVKPNGSWAATISSLRSRDLSVPFTLEPTTPVRIQVLGTGRDEKIETDVTGANLAPAPELKFGQAPDLSGELLAPTPPAEVGGIGGAFNELYSEEEAEAAGSSTVQITFPKREGELVTTEQPELSGKAPANTYLQIEVHSTTPQNGVVQTDETGQWRWSPPDGLEPGEHTMTVTYTDDSGNQQKITRTFLVQANTGGSSLPSFIATPSAVVVPSPTPTPTIIAQVATPVPTPTPTPLPTATPPIGGAQPVSGSTMNTAGMIVLALSFFGLGVWGTHRATMPRERR